MLPPKQFRAGVPADQQWELALAQYYHLRMTNHEFSPTGPKIFITELLNDSYLPEFQEFISKTEQNFFPLVIMYLKIKGLAIFFS